MSLILVGTNYRFSPLELREWIIANNKQAEYWLEYFKRKFADIEIVILGTCNRFEIYIRKPLTVKLDAKDILCSLAQEGNFPVEQFHQNFYCYRNSQAIRHLFRVSCAMDSMLIGEHQISGQVKKAYMLAQEKGTVSSYLARLFETSLKLAKRMRTEANISTGHFSLGSVAVEFITRTFGQFGQKKILVIGAGKMGRTVITNLIINGAKFVTLINRDILRAKEIGKSLPTVQIGSWDNLSENLISSDVIISCLSTDEPILRYSDINVLKEMRNNRPLLIIDLGLPRNIDSRVGELPWVHLYDLNVLEDILAEQNRKRREELAKYEYLIDVYVDEYISWLNQKTISPVICELRKKLHCLAENELARLNGKLSENVSAKDRQLIEQMAYRLTQKFLHDPISFINEQIKNRRGNIYAGIVKQLFNLDMDLQSGSHEELMRGNNNKCSFVRQ